MPAYLIPYLTTATVALLGFICSARQLRVAFYLWSAALTLMIGLRHEVGGDWYNYLEIFNNVTAVSAGDAVLLTDPAYALLNQLSNRVGGEIYLVNMGCAVVFMSGLVRYCRKQPLPWLALTVAMPYLVTVVAMGYTRQSAALGMALHALCALERPNLKAFSFWILLAALFHKSAVFVFLLLPLYVRRGEGVRLYTTFAAMILAAGVLLGDAFFGLWSTYVEARMVSEGGAVRVWMNFVPAILLLAYGKRWKRTSPNSFRYLRLLAIAALVCIPLQSIASTAIDRLVLYVAPLQVGVFSRLPLFAPPLLRLPVVLAIVMFYLAVLITWLTYSPFAQCCWVPYQTP